MGEVWKLVVSNPDYEISDQGKIRSWKSCGRSVTKRVAPKILSPGVDGSGYSFIILDGRSKNKRIAKIHTLVAEHFLDKFDCAEVVNHIDENKQNNSVENLEWVTQSENQIHSFGKRVTLTNGVEVRKFRAVREAARDLGLDDSAVSRLLSGEYKQTHGWSLVGGESIRK